jgi:hypothetical protein
VTFANAGAQRHPVLDRRLAVRRGFPVRPMTRRDAEAAHPMNVEAAHGAVEREILELALEVGFHLQEFEPEHLRVDGDRVIAPTRSLASSTSSSAFVACSAMVRTACSRISRSRAMRQDASRGVRPHGVNPQLQSVLWGESVRLSARRVASASLLPAHTTHDHLER